MSEEIIMPTNNKLVSEIPLDLQPGESKDLEIPAPDNGKPFFAGFKIPDGKKVFYIGKDISGTDTLRLRFYNSDTAPVTIHGFIRQ
ncbi:hypothetical protein [Bacillus cereus]|uniref:hypothetical protein n=1 Tax=Bacillus cereus TaxID=1396 RepID=UPI000BF921D3|nr:hypothetical protein [Bacillus cereus]PFT30402.1 hypothetical protein COK71_22265 [Bacillus cereus]